MEIVYPILGEQITFPFYVSGVGITDSEYHIERRQGLISHQILISLSGAGKLRVDGKTYQISQGDFFYLKSGIPHEYYPNQSGEWKTGWVVFRGNLLNSIMETMGFGDYYVGKVKDEVYAQALLRKILDAAKEPFLGLEKSSEALYEYIMYIRKMVLGFEEQDGSCSRLEPAIERMEKNYNQDISLQELTELTGISKQHFCRLFRQQFGMRPMEYLAKKRVAQAKILLEQTDMSVQEVGKKVGYTDYNYFGIVFKKYEGVSPGKYRNGR